MRRSRRWREKRKAAASKIFNPQTNRLGSAHRAQSATRLRQQLGGPTQTRHGTEVRPSGSAPAVADAPCPPPSAVRAGRVAPRQPRRREDFRIAILCALPREYDALSLIFDESWWDEDAGDSTHSTARIGKHNAVVALLPGMGKASAASTAAAIRSRYPNVRLAFLVGICGGVPHSGTEEILLGDVVISNVIVQYDFGRQYPNKFEPRDGLQNSMAKPDKDFRILLAQFETADGRQRLQQRTAGFLQQLQATATSKNLGAKYDYPGTAQDKLFSPSYRHKHHLSPTCICRKCATGSDPVCADAKESSCDNLRCDEQHLVPRKRLMLERNLDAEKAQEPAIHIGPVGSGDTVIKSGEHRDGIAQPHRIVAFEMEGAGVSEEIPCVVVKGVCDYADCHKNKKWQDFAAATAASALKAVLERYTDPAENLNHLLEAAPLRSQFFVPFGRNRDFVGRKSTLEQLLERIPPGADEDDCQRTAIEGLGGVGKTQIALEVAFQVRNMYPDCHIFWVPATDATSFENAYREIGRRLQVPGVNEEKADVKILVQMALTGSVDNWLLIIDNADDVELLFGAATGATPLCDYLPFSHLGSILFTTRNHDAVMRLDIPQRGIFKLAEMSTPEAADMLQRNLEAHQLSDTKSTSTLLDFLTNLPLAIKQASAYMAKTGMTATQYLNHCQSGNERLIELLGKEFEDRGRYTSTQNPIAATWLITFHHISRDDPLAARYLKFMSLLGEKGIPKSLLPPGKGGLRADEAIATLKAYAFIAEQDGQEAYDIHRLVRLAMRNWLAENRELKNCATTAVKQVGKVFPKPEHENRTVWAMYLPHALAALEFRDQSADDVYTSDLLSSVGKSHSMLGKHQDAESFYRQALKLRAQLLGREHLGTLYAMNSLGTALERQGKKEEAERIYRYALRSLRALDTADPLVLACINNLAIVLTRQRKFGEAETIHRQTLKLRTQLLGMKHPDTLCSAGNIGTMLFYQGNYQEAESIHRQTLKLRTQVLGIEHPETLSSLNNLALTLRKQSIHQEAEALYRQVLEIRTRVFGIEHPHTITGLNNLAITLDGQGNYEEAETLYRRALVLKTQVLGVDHPSTIRSMNSLTTMLRRQGKDQEVEAIQVQKQV